MESQFEWPARPDTRWPPRRLATPGPRTPHPPRQADAPCICARPCSSEQLVQAAERADDPADEDDHDKRVDGPGRVQRVHREQEEPEQRYQAEPFGPVRSESLDSTVPAAPTDKRR